MHQRRLKEGLDLKGDPAGILAYRDSLTGLEYLRRGVNFTERGFSVELHAYQCHVFLDWRELRATAEKPWDRLCDHLAGRGVPDLEEALIRLELVPAHDALRRLLEPAVVRTLAELSGRVPVGPEKLKAFEFQRDDFFHTAWRRSREFLREAQSFYRGHDDQSLATHLINPEAMEERFRDRVRAAMRIPALESLFPEPWPAAARRVLPSASPQLTATALWGPVLAWCVLELLAESADARNPERLALDLFDRLRLREPLGNAFKSLGFEGEECWRVAARIKVALLIEAKVFAPAAPPAAAVPVGPPADSVAQPQAAPEQLIPILSPALWQDPDIRWLTGAHEDKGHAYFVKESYEELLWWLQLPALCRLAAEPVPARSTIQKIRRAFSDAAELAASASYSVDMLIEPRTGVAEGPDSSPAEPKPAAEEPAAQEKNPADSPGE